MLNSNNRPVTDSRALNAAQMINMAVEYADPKARLAMLADAQRQIGLALRSGIAEALDEGVKWTEIGDAVQMPRETAFRQYQSQGPISVVRATHTKQEQEAMTNAIYAFELENGTWFGPSDALGPEQYTSAILPFNPNPAVGANRFGGQMLRVRFGPWEKDAVTAHAAQVRLPDRSEMRMPVTSEVLDLLFDQTGQTQLRQALMAAHYATGTRANVDPAVTAAVLKATDAMTPTVPEPRFIAAVRDALRIAAAKPSPDPAVRTAINRLVRAVRDYDRWAAVGTN